MRSVSQHVLCLTSLHGYGEDVGKNAILKKARQQPTRFGSDVGWASEKMGEREHGDVCLRCDKS